MNNDAALFIIVFGGATLFCLGVFAFLGLILAREGWRRCHERRVADPSGSST